MAMSMAHGVIYSAAATAGQDYDIALAQQLTRRLDAAKSAAPATPCQ